MPSRLANDIRCEVCGTAFKPWRESQRFCSRPCYHSWWRAEVRPAATDAGTEAKKRLADEGITQQRKGNRWHSENPSPRSKTARLERDRTTLATASELDPESDDIGAAWLERAQYWESVGREAGSDRDAAPFNAPRVDQPPLILNGHGVRLKIHQGALVVRNGFTHYPQENEEFRFFQGDRKLPSRIIALDCDGSISLDVIAWLGSQHVPLVLIDWNGQVRSVVGNIDGPYRPELREVQRAALTNGVGPQLATELIRRKVGGCEATLQTFWRSPTRDNGIRKLQRVLDDLQEPPLSIEALRLTEARAALAYFLCWQEVAVAWKGIGRKPIPVEWHRAGLRQGVLQDGTNRHATHPVNSMLNYAYAVLESQLRIAVIAYGLDPTVGYLHAIQPRRLAVVYDLMEPLRPEVDRVVLEFVKASTFMPADFVLTATGICRLHPQLSRRIAALTLPVESINGVVELAISRLAGVGSRSPKPGHGGLTGSGVVRRGRPGGHAETSAGMAQRTKSC